jgi:hypothetical protein
VRGLDVAPGPCSWYQVERRGRKRVSVGEGLHGKLLTYTAQDLLVVPLMERTAPRREPGPVEGRGRRRSVAMTRADGVGGWSAEASESRFDVAGEQAQIKELVGTWFEGLEAEPFPPADRRLVEGADDDGAAGRLGV